MTSSPLVHAILARLRDAHYRDVSTPLRVAGVEFEFTSVMIGQDGRALDLIVLVDTTTGEFGDRDPVRVRQRIEGLSRALDVTGSRYVVTVILAGATLAGEIDTLAETCRVLLVESLPLDADGTPANDVAKKQLEDRIRVLLPLSIPPAVAEQDGGGTAIEQLLGALPKGTSKPMIEAIVAASQDGDEAVTTAIAEIINEAISKPPEQEAPI